VHDAGKVTRLFVPAVTRSVLRGALLDSAHPMAYESLGNSVYAKPERKAAFGLKGGAAAEQRDAGG